jgi:DNA-binding NarL/FixJ family response regulator
MLTAEQEHRSAPPRILFVDDHEPTRRALIRVAGGRWVEWIACGTRTEAFAAIERSAGPLAGAIVDVQLPDGSGLDVLEYLRTTCCGPVLVITAHRLPHYSQRAYCMGAEFVLKPIEREVVLAFLGRVEAERSQQVGVQRRLDRTTGLRTLTAAQRRLMHLLATRASREEIAASLGISINTLKGRVRVLLRRTGGFADVDQMLAQLPRS